jgi:hypothetical protein
MSAGSRLFARYAFAPNDLGYCGPAESATLFELAVTGSTDADVTEIARGFSGAWPYLTLLAELTGIQDPLDERVVRGYWTGSELLHDLDQRAFGSRLIDLLGSRAGHYWRHLSADLLPEATPTHGFHVFGIYPWSRLLGVASAQPLNVLDNCRIRWGQVQKAAGDHVVVRSRRLAWDGRSLQLAAPAVERVRLSVGGRGFVGEPEPGEWLGLHWDWVCDRLTATEQAQLEHWTGWQLARTNARLARQREAAG